MPNITTGLLSELFSLSQLLSDNPETAHAPKTQTRDEGARPKPGTPDASTPTRISQPPAQNTNSEQSIIVFKPLAIAVARAMLQPDKSLASSPSYATHTRSLEQRLNELSALLEE